MISPPWLTQIHTHKQTDRHSDRLQPAILVAQPDELKAVTCTVVLYQCYCFKLSVPVRLTRWITQRC